MRVPRQRCYHIQIRVLPDADLILCSRTAEPVRTHELMRGQGPDEIADLIC
jgi:hypothetical protein